MPTNVIMPQMGESIFEGTVTKWLKKTGEAVLRDEPLFEISTDKVDAEIPSPAAGVLTSVLVKEGQTVQINTIVAVLDGDGAAIGAAAPASAAPAPEPAAPAEPSPAKAAPSAASTAAPAVESDADVRSSPLVRKMAKEYNVDLAQVVGTGSGGRISKQDLLDYVAGAGKSGKPATPAAPAAPKPVPAEPKFAAPPAAPVPAAPKFAAPPASAPAPTPAPAVVFSGTTRVEPMSGMRSTIAKRMVESKHTSAHVTTVFQADVTRIAKLRDKAKEEFQRQHGLKLTYTPFLVRAAAEALRAFPVVNASVDGTNIVYKRDINVGIAVALDWGLIVPVVMHCEEKSFLGIARSIADLAERARTKKLSPDELQNGTFTVTNPGNIGGLFATPIINQPQVAIMGVGQIHKAAVVVNDGEADAIAIRTVVYLTLSFDHRIIDGAVADQFMAYVKNKLETWEESLG
jgi:pyruvate dehydrogenase E2 component (dihydrolipoamide acetyltransferase)